MTGWAKIRLLAAVGAAIAGGVASASAMVPQSGSDTVGGPDVVQPDGGPVTVGAPRPDPEGGADWAVRVYRSKTGATCPEAGRTSGGSFGAVDSTGAFVALPVEAAGSCGDLQKNLAAFAVDQYPATAQRGARTVLFGAASPRVRAVTLTTAGTSEPLELDHGSFLLVRASLDLDRAVLVLTTYDDATTSYSLATPAP